MANPQTTETTSQVLYGAVKIEVSATSDFAAPVDIGAANGVKFTEELKISTLETDNAVDRDAVTEQKAMIEWEQIEVLNESALAIMRGDLDDIVNTPGALVTGASQTITSGDWVYNQFTPITHQNGDGSTISITTVTASTNGVLVAGTDYFKVKNEDGVYGIIVVDSATVTTEAQNIVIIYNYTPNASTAYYTGGGTSDVPTFYVRLTNEDEDGKVVRITTLGTGNITKGYELAFKKYNAEDTRVPMPVSVTVRQDITLTAGRQLYVREVIAA